MPAQKSSSQKPAIGVSDVGSPLAIQLPEIGAESGLTPKPKSGGLLDSVIFALMGTPDAVLQAGGDESDIKARSQRRSQAGDKAAAAANGDLGDSYMGAPGTSGSGFGLNDILNLVGKII